MFIRLTLILFLSAVLGNCKKNDSLSSTTAIESFWHTSDTRVPVLSLIHELKKQNAVTGFIPEFIRQNGFALWDRSILSEHPDSTGQFYLIVPMHFKNVMKIHAALICRINQGKNVISIRLVDARNYSSHKKVNGGPVPADISLLMMQLTNHCFPVAHFQIVDQQSVKGLNPAARLVRFDSTSAFKVITSTISICVTVTIANNNGQLVGCPGGNADCPPYHEERICRDFSIWWDDGQGFEGSGSDYIESDPITGGGTNGGPGNGLPGDPCNSISRSIVNGKIRPSCNSHSSDWQTGWDPVLGVPSQSPQVLLDYSGLENPVNTDDNFFFNPRIQLDTVPLSSYYGRYIASTTPRNNTEDMDHGTDGDIADLFTIGLYSPPYTARYLFDKMITLFEICTSFDALLRVVAMQMVEHFKTGNGERYENVVLNKKVKESAEYHRFVERVAQNINLYLRTHNDEPDSLQLPDLLYRPIFNSTYHKFHGLQILVNDTERTEIFINNFQFSQDRKSWSADITSIITDHFGLDKHDALSYQWYHQGFPAWWWLQHKLDYKPFETLITVRHHVTYNR